MPIDFLTIKEFCNFITLMIGLKMIKIAYFGLQSIEIFTGGGFALSPLVVIVTIQCEIVLWKSLIMFTPLGN